MFSSEFDALVQLNKLSAFRIPKPFFHGAFDKSSIIIMEFIENGITQDFEQFGRTLALMHQNTQSHFGYKANNFIGTLFQDNSNSTSAVEHYKLHRIQPMISLASSKGLLNNNDLLVFQHFFKELDSILPNALPAFVHGDLWNGNMFFDKNGKGVIFDPAISYSLREFDIAMMHLFGAFPASTFAAYNETYPLVSGWESRMKYFKLYFLLVHLCIFGSSYHSNVMSCLKKFI